LLESEESDPSETISRAPLSVRNVVTRDPIAVHGNNIIDPSQSISDIQEQDASNLRPLLMRDNLPVFIDGSARDTPLDQSEEESLADSTGSRHHEFDSEGSDIYGDLSTARSGMNTSSNRLNEILDDDDYLEHMERGVPMNRSISTPYSDEEAPMFIVEDDLAELMERGEPRQVDGALRAASVVYSEADSNEDVDEEPRVSLDACIPSSTHDDSLRMESNEEVELVEPEEVRHSS
jgi:hypothetical protein